MKIKNNILKIVLVSLLALGFNACDDNSEKKVKFPKPEWDNRLSDVEPKSGKWFQLADEDEKAAFNIGNTYSIKLKNYKKAIEWYLYSDSIKINSDNLLNLANTYEDLKQYEDAIKYMKKSFQLGKNEAAYNLGLIYSKKLNDYKNAEIWFKKAIERKSLSAIKNIGLLYHESIKNDLKASAYYITLIDKRYSKEEVLNLLKNKWKIPNDIIQKGYELQLNSPDFPIKYKGGLESLK